jgi:hypothetical protein
MVQVTHHAIMPAFLPEMYFAAAGKIVQNWRDVLE